MVMYYRQIAAATALYATLALFGALARVPAGDDDAGGRSGQAAPAYILETGRLHLKEKNIIP